MHNSSLTYLFDDEGSASYNAMRASLVMNRSNGVTGSIAYTWSRLIGNVTDLTSGFLNQTGNPGYQDYYRMHGYERSVLATDIPQRIVGNVSYPLPFGRGTALGSGMPGWANELAGGWTLNGIVSVQSG